MTEHTWIGTAAKITQITTITIADTWATGDVANIICNGNTLAVTIGTDSATTDVAAAISAAINAADRTTDLVNDESRNIGGQEIPEFREFTASVSGSVVTLTGNTPGKPFTVTVSETTAGDGTVGSPSDSQACTGPNWFDNAANWSSGSVPADADTIIFNAGSVDLLYGLGQSGITPATINRTAGYTGRIGLAEYNADDPSYVYKEYRTKALTLGNSGDAQTVTVNIGDGAGNGSGRTRLATGTAQTIWNVYSTGNREQNDVPSLLLTGTHASNVLNLIRGDVGIAYYQGETATVATLKIGYRDNPDGDSQCVCGSGVTLTTIDQSGGELEVSSNVTTLNKTGGQYRQKAGTLATANADGGVLLYDSTGTLTTGRIGGGATLDLRQAVGDVTITNLELHAGAAYYDPAGRATITNGWDFVRCTPAELQAFVIVPHRTLTASAI